MEAKNGKDKPYCTELKTYSFTNNDIDLITYALRQLSNTCGLATVRSDAKELRAYTEKLRKENDELAKINNHGK